MGTTIQLTILIDGMNCRNIRARLQVFPSLGPCLSHLLILRARDHGGTFVGYICIIVRLHYYARVYLDFKGRLTVIRLPI